MTILSYSSIDSCFLRRGRYYFDGTISLIREGWPDVMLPMFEELLPNIQGDISESVRKMLLDDIMTLNGKQTIYQMIRFCERIIERGGNPEDPIYYKREYLRRISRGTIATSQLFNIQLFAFYDI